MRSKDKGFTLIELLAVIVILAIILAIAIPSISGIVKESTKRSFQSDAKMVLKAIEYAKLKDENFNPADVTKDNITSLLGLSNVNYSNISVVLENNVSIVNIVGTEKWNGLIACGSYKNMKVVENINQCIKDITPPVITLGGAETVNIFMNDTYSDTGATAVDDRDGDVTSSIIVAGSVNTSLPGTYKITYTVSDSSGNTTVKERVVIVNTKANAPVLATGMVPIKWSDGAWVDTTISDPEWYSYTATDKKWANARTANGSTFWVWIPRFTYKISSGWHTGGNEVIDINFSLGTDDTIGGTLSITNTGSATDSNNKWTNQPAFALGTTELTGFWMGKYEVSYPGGPYDAIVIKPNVSSCTMTRMIKECYSYTLSMQNKSGYGWEGTGSGIDTHFVRNTEWGAVAYLSQSIYGKNSKIWINNSSTCTTGCAGNSESEDPFNGCQNTYDSPLGGNASTTGNIYGVYDMVGGLWEYTASYVSNGHANVNSAATDTFIGANAMYKNIYTGGATDTTAAHYALTINKKGDAIYEVNSDTGYGGMPVGSTPWFLRGGHHTSGAGANIYASGGGNGYGYNVITTRAVLSVGAGL